MSGDELAWTAANQRFIAAELAWLKHRLDDGTPAVAIDESLAAAAATLPAPAAIDVLVDLFGLSVFERRLLLLCAGVELDDQLAATCARIHGNDGHRHVTFGLALATLPDAHWSALTPERPLRRWRLVELGAGARLVDSPLRIDERVLHFLAGINLLDPRLQSLLVHRRPATLMAAEHAALVERLAASWATSSTAFPVIQLTGDDAMGQEDVAASIAERLGMRVYVLNGAELTTTFAELDTLSILCEREMRLFGGALFLQCADAPASAAAGSLAGRLQTPLFIAAREPMRLPGRVLSQIVDRPQPLEQRRLWQQALGERFARLNGSIDALAGNFRLSARTIAAVAESMDGDEVPASSQLPLWQACRVVGRQRLDDLAERIVPAATWADLVLPETTLATLRQIAAHVRQRVRVHEEWRFADRIRRGVGVTALFTGESGTGKTLAAEVLAHELRLDLYRIDLSSVVSKYIGETEKNLKRVFDAAEDGGSILLFDEADALFGKRSEVKDSHDRYANIEISYLLQRMEAYRGLAVLTTNMKTSLDRAFQRRLRFVLTFPFPDYALRQAIWQRVFPAETPLAAIDYGKLARLHLPGGSIRNIALNAAFLAADGGSALRMDHLLAAAQAESAKCERPLSESETRGWV